MTTTDQLMTPEMKLAIVERLAVSRQVYARALATQQETVALLRSGSGGSIGGEFVVDPGALDVVAQQGCGNDSGHGPGTCVFPDTDGLCPACTIEYLQQHLTDGQHISIDVLL